MAAIAKGEFEVTITPQQDEDAPVGRMRIEKNYHGALSGTGLGQMISKQLENGTAVYFAIEEFSGKLGDKEGDFTLLHQGAMTSNSQSLMVTILEGSGYADLESIAGSMTITEEAGKHLYELNYHF